MRQIPILMVAMTLLVSACAAPRSSTAITRTTAQQMVGRTASEVEAVLGPARNRSAFALVYETRQVGPPVRQSTARVSLGGGDTSASLSAGRPVLTCQWTFQIGPDETITGWDASGQLCASLI